MILRILRSIASLVPLRGGSTHAPSLMPTIRPLHYDDIADVLRLNREAAPAVFRLDRSELSRLMDISALHLAVVRPDGAMAGYALAFSKDQSYDGEEFLAFEASVADPFIYVDQIVVEERSRGTGIGRALYEALALRARRLGASALCCEVNLEPPNPRSLSFHLRIGFNVAGEISTTDGRTVALLRREA